jgi:peptidoglycan hydrolase-like protein with peptidoglycan-binding domain
VIGTRSETTRLTAATSTGLGLVVLLALLSACSNGNAASIGGVASDASAPKVVSEPTTATTPVAVTPPTTIATTTTTSTTVPPTTVATTTTTSTTTTTTLVPAPLFPVTPITQRASGNVVKVLQSRLLQVGFWLDAVDGHYGPATTQAVMAFQKYWNLPTKSGRVDRATANALNTVKTKPVAKATTGDLFEVNKAGQVGFVVRNGKAVWTLNVSTGSGHPYTAVSHKDLKTKLAGDAQTPDGLFHVNRQRPVGWWEGELGRLYRPKYFNGGIAVHGSNSIPNYPASHGCVRVSTVAMDWIWNDNIIPLHSVVWVHS